MPGSSSMMPAMKEAMERIRINNALYFLKNDIAAACEAFTVCCPKIGEYGIIIIDG
jgi:hypothetical protein